MKKSTLRHVLATLPLLAATLAAPLQGANPSKSNGPRLEYPAARKDSAIDDYFGTKVPDPYRWLEDTNSAEVKSWVEAENKVTLGYLATIPFRSQVTARLLKLYNYPKFTAPARRGEWFFFSKNDGLQNQSVQYRQKGLDGPPEVLLDPNTFSTEGTAKLGAFSLSPSGKYVLYGISQGGSDWNDLYVLDVATREKLTDHLQWIKNGGGSWQGEEGFYYSRYPTPEKGRELTTKNEFQAVYFHRLGQPQSADELVYEDREHPQRFQSVGVTEDQRFAILYVSERQREGW